MGGVDGITIAEMVLSEPLERAAGLDQPSASLAAARDGRGQACVIEGRSGVVKTRLLDECADSRLACTCCASCELTRDYPFNIIHTPALAEPVFGHGRPPTSSASSAASTG